jgi:sulfur carrier protein
MLFIASFYQLLAPAYPTGMFKKPADQYLYSQMKIIFPDKSSRQIVTLPRPLEQVLLEMGINPLDVLVSREGTLVTEDTLVGNDDEIRIIRISHGG